MGGNLVTVGLGFGDEGKGSFIDYFKDGYTFFVKYNGGCQGRHTVNTESGTFSFAQLSPGILNRDSKVLLSKNFVFEPFALYNEVDALSKQTGISKRRFISQLFVDDKCICVSPYHKLYNQLEEETYAIRGSVGTGVSIAKKYSTDECLPICEELGLSLDDIVIRANHLNEMIFIADLEVIIRRLKAQRKFFMLLCEKNGINPHRIKHFSYLSYIGRLYNALKKCMFQVCDTESYIRNNKGNVLYESTQGLLLDNNYGFAPNTTYLDTSLDSLSNVSGKRVGFIRSLYTRHGQGVFPTESDELGNLFVDASQEIGVYNGKLRFGWFDLVLFKYALRMTNVNEIDMSHLDYLHHLDNVNVCCKYEYKGEIDNLFEDLFSYITDGKIFVIDIKKPHKLMGEYLNKMSPCYTNIDLVGLSFKEKCNKYLGYIESECGVPVRIVSMGANRVDKAERGLFDD